MSYKLFLPRERKSDSSKIGREILLLLGCFLSIVISAIGLARFAIWWWHETQYDAIHGLLIFLVMFIIATAIQVFLITFFEKTVERNKRLNSLIT